MKTMWPPKKTERCEKCGEMHSNYDLLQSEGYCGCGWEVGTDYTGRRPPVVTEPEDAFTFGQ